MRGPKGRSPFAHGSGGNFKPPEADSIYIGGAKGQSPLAHGSGGYFKLSEADSIISSGKALNTFDLP